MAKRKQLSGLDMGSVATIVNLPTPVVEGDAASKGYIDTSLDIPDPVLIFENGLL